MTLIGIFSLFSLFEIFNRRILFNAFIFYLFPAFIGISFVSNKLFAFTFISPIIFLFIYLEIILISKSTNCLYSNRQITSQIYIQRIIYRVKLILFEIINLKNHKKILFLSLPIFLASFSFQFLLDLQCLDPISFKVFNPIKELYDLILLDKLLIVFLFLNILLLVFSLYRLYKNLEVSESSYQKIQIGDLFLVKTEILSIFIALSSISPLLYIWITNNVIIRYLLILPLLIPLTIIMTSYFLIQDLNIFVLKFIINISRKIIFIGLTIYCLNSNIITLNSLKYFFNPKDIFYTSALNQRVDYARDYEQINHLGLQYGLSDFWGSSVTYFGNDKIDVLPILSNGFPNLWSHSIYNFRDNDLGEIKKYNFIYSRDTNFSKSIIDTFGNPDKIYKIVDRNTFPILISALDFSSRNHMILIYNNQDFKNKINLLFKDRISSGCRNY
tara:strand:- start:2301 stop:3629 length:1329 start_codon:yes stop_codon:yes gene_type:complete